MTLNLIIRVWPAVDCMHLAQDGANVWSVVDTETKFWICGVLLIEKSLASNGGIIHGVKLK